MRLALLTATLALVALVLAWSMWPGVPMPAPGLMPRPRPASLDAGGAG